MFDAIAALAGIRQQVNYEAQAAIEFESLLDESESRGYHFEIQNGIVDPRPVIMSLLVDIQGGVSVPSLSARFHNGVAEMVREVCRQIKHETGLNEIALSGGVWQNMALLKRTVHRLRIDGFTVFVDHQIPTNDGGLSLGQAMVTATRLKGGLK